MVKRCAVAKGGWSQGQVQLGEHRFSLLALLAPRRHPIQHARDGLRADRGQQLQRRRDRLQVENRRAARHQHEVGRLRRLEGRAFGARRRVDDHQLSPGLGGGREHLRQPRRLG